MRRLVERYRWSCDLFGCKASAETHVKPSYEVIGETELRPAGWVDLEIRPDKVSAEPLNFCTPQHRRQWIDALGRAYGGS
jgi:hypothetical protein